MLSATIALFSLCVLQAPAVWAHGLVTNISFDGVSYPAWSPYTSPYKNPLTVSIERKIDANGPIDFTTAIIATGEGTQAAQFDAKDPVTTAAVKGGATVTFSWDTWPSSHLGPIMNYMANCNGDCTGVVGADLEWFKIEQVTYDSATKTWPTATLAQTLKYTFKLPDDIPSGNYLLRHELLAMHTVGGPQFYPRVVQIDLTTSGGTAPKITGKFPNIDFKTWNIYNNDNSQFVPPGIALYNGASSGADSTTVAAAPSAAPASVAASSNAATLVAALSAANATSAAVGVPPGSSSAIPAASSESDVAVPTAPTTMAGASSVVASVVPPKKTTCKKKKRNLSKPLRYKD